MHKASHTTHPPVYLAERARRALKALPLAALLAIGAPQAWADDEGGEPLDLNDGTFAYNGVLSGSGNNVTVTNSYAAATGGYAHNGDRDANENTLTIDGGTVGTASGGDASNGWAANGNNVFIKNGGKVNGKIFGGRSSGSYASDYYSSERRASTANNTVTVEDGTVGYIYGGYSLGLEALAENNTVTIKGGTVRSIQGGAAVTNYDYNFNPKSARGNTVTIEGGTVEESIYGGYAECAYNTFYTGASATDNTVILAGGTVGGDVAGGYSFECSGTFYDTFIKGNTLKVQSKGFSVGGKVSHFENLAFTLPADIAADDVMLSVDSADFESSGDERIEVNVTIDLTGQPALNEGDAITLIDAANAATGDNGLRLALASDTVTAGGYTFALSVEGTKLIATVDSAPAGGNTGGDTGGNTGGDTGGDTGGNTGGNTGGDTGGSTGGDTGGSTGGDTGGDTGGSTGGGSSSAPTMGEFGLLLSGLALAGAAAPSLRRRERKERKQD